MTKLERLQEEYIELLTEKIEHHREFIKKCEEIIELQSQMIKILNKK